MKIDEKKRKSIELGIKILAFLTAIIFFLPIAKMEIWGTTTTSSFCNLAFGEKIAGVQVTEGSFGFIFVLILPLAIAALIQFIHNNNIVKYGGSIFLSVVELIIYIAGANKAKEGSYGLVQTTFWMVLACIFLGVIIIASVGLLLSKGEDLNSDIKGFVGAVQESASKVSGAIGSAVPKKKCQKCGAELEWNAAFCPKCGEKYVAPEPKRCQQCGSIIGEEDIFCPKCGAKYEKPVVIICPKCGAKNEKDAMFCEKCGTKLVDEN